MTRNIIWSPRSRRDYFQLLDYLLNTWGPMSVKKFNTRFNKVLNQITAYPDLYPATKKISNIRRCVLSKQTTLYYRVKNHDVELVTLFDNRQHPSKKKLR